MLKTIILLIALFATTSVFGLINTVNGVTQGRIADTNVISDFIVDGLDSSLLPPPNGDPQLYFSDLISGPSTGIGDALGSGVIVTVWGTHLGSSQGTSTIEFTDNPGTTRSGYVYYWKDADSVLPSGPANLYESHRMQEVAFSIPFESVAGLGQITITTDTGNTSIPFTVRTGSIYHVTPLGNDSTGDGSFGSPWLTVTHADSNTPSGSTLYIHDVTTGDEETDIAIFTNTGSMSSSLAAQYAYVAYPNTRPEVIGWRGFGNYNGTSPVSMEGIIQSKFAIFAAEGDEDVNGQPVNVRANVTYGIIGSKNGRAVGNAITDAHPGDVSGACPDGQNAAIVANASSSDRVSNFKVYGNHIYDYGCPGTNRQHHTTYFSIRSAENNLQLEAPEAAFNYLSNNETKYGIHYFDENLTGVQCGQYTTTFKVHDNVIINQAGSALTYMNRCPVNTQFDIYNNVAINSGMKNSWDGISGPSTNPVSSSINISPDTNATSTLNIYNNTFYHWDVADETPGNAGCISLNPTGDLLTINYNDNICVTDGDKEFITSYDPEKSNEDNFVGGGNVWYSTVGTHTLEDSPPWDATKIIVDPKIIVTGSTHYLDTGSPIDGLNKGAYIWYNTEVTP